MSLIVVFILLILGMSFTIGFIGFEEIDFIIDVKYYSHPYYHLGISFVEHSAEDEGYIEQELIIGLFFINIVFVFYKEKN